MFKKPWETLLAGMKEQERLLDALDRRSEKMETILMIREPSSTAAADAYDGLRKQVVSTMTERLTHLSQLVQFDSAMTHGADAAVLTSLLHGWFEEAGLKKESNPAHPQADFLYELVEDHGGPLEVCDPAYVDDRSGRIIRRGRARRPAPTAAPAPTSKLENYAEADDDPGVDAAQPQNPVAPLAGGTR